MADTQSMPALVKALTGVLPDGAVRSLMQALGNCNQPYASRSAQNFQEPEQLGNVNGVYAGGRWNPSQYPGLLPSAGSPGFVDIPGGGGWQGGDYYGGNTNVNNYGGTSFFFPTSQEFALNNYYGGPILNVGGNSTFNTIDATNINVSYINNTFVGGGGGTVVSGGGGTGATPIPLPLPGGAPGSGPGFGVPVVLPGFPGGGPLTGEAAQNVTLSGWVEVEIPTDGTLLDDCSVKLKPGKAKRIQVSLRPRTIRTLV